MNAMLFTVANCEVHPAHGSQLLRAGYLACTQTLAIGDIVNHMLIKGKLASYKRMAKLDYLLDDRTKLTRKDKQLVLKIQAKMRTFQKLKHPSPAQIKDVKLSEVVIDGLHKIASLQQLKATHVFGLFQLEPLAFTPELKLHFLRDQFETDDDNTRPSLKEMLTLDKLDKQKNDLFYLAMELMLTLEQENLPFYSPNDKEAVDEANVWFHTICELPNLLTAEIDTLKALRQMFDTPRQMLNEAADQWLYQCYTDTAAAERLVTVQQMVVPACLAFRKVAEETETLRSMGIQYNWGNVTRLMIGEIPVPLLFSLFQKRKLINEELHAELQEWAKQEGWDKKRWPVLAMQFTKEMMDTGFVTGQQPEPEPLQLKKSISLD